MVDVAEIAERLDDLEKRFATAERERDQYRQLYLETMERCRKLELGLLSSKSEHLPKNESQLSLDVLTMVLDERQRERHLERHHILPTSCAWNASRPPDDVN